MSTGLSTQVTHAEGTGDWEVSVEKGQTPAVMLQACITSIVFCQLVLSPQSRLLRKTILVT